MNDKEYEKQKKRVQKCFYKWRTPLGIGWWRVTLEYSREGMSSTRYEPSDHNGKFACVLAVTSDYYYKTAVIEANLPVIQEVKDEDLDRYMLHELMHLHLKPMQHPDKTEQEELVATSLADAILWVVEAVKKKDL